MRVRLDDLLLRMLLGRRWKEKLWISKKDKSELETQLLIRTTPVLTESWGLQPTTIHIDADHSAFNPSIVKMDDGFLLIARSSNLVNLNDGNYFYRESPHKERNYLLRLDQNLRTLSQTALDDSAIVQNGMPAEYGIADARLFRWRDSIWLCGGALAPASRQGDMLVQQVLCQIEGNRIGTWHVLPSPYQRPVEKNWSPIVDSNRLHLTYSLSPLEVLHFEERAQSLRRVRKHEGHPGVNLRGGTPFIKWKGVYLSVAHSNPLHHEGKRYYVHHFVTLNSSFELLEISEPFFIQRKGTEFASGIELVPDGVLLAYGVADRACRLITIPSTVLDRYLTV